MRRFLTVSQPATPLGGISTTALSVWTGFRQTLDTMKLSRPKRKRKRNNNSNSSSNGNSNSSIIRNPFDSDVEGDLGDDLSAISLDDGAQPPAPDNQGQDPTDHRGNNAAEADTLSPPETDEDVRGDTTEEDDSEDAGHDGVILASPTKKRVKIIGPPNLSRAGSESPASDTTTELATARATMTLINTAELELIRWNNASLRKHNVDFARDNSKLKVEVNRLRDEAQDLLPSKDEVERLKARLTTLESGKKALETEKETYWQCGIEWARKEHLWGVERNKYRGEILSLTAKVKKLEAEIDRLSMQEGQESEPSMGLGINFGNASTDQAADPQGVEPRDEVQE